MIMSRIFNDIKTVLFDEQRKSLPKIVRELIRLSVKEKEIPLHYFNCLLYKKENKNIDNYISNNKMQRIIHEVFYANGKENENLDDKLLFSEKLIRHNIETPKTLLYNYQTEFYMDGSKINLSNIDKFIKIIQGILEQREVIAIFIKPVDGIGGTNSFKVDRNAITENHVMLNIFNTVVKGNYLFQETINQHSSINKIYSSSINTLRVHTYTDTDGNKKIASALMRFGMGGSVIDNGSAGGFYIPVDTENWSLEGKGRNYFRSGGVMYEAHPDTNFRLDGFKIPFSKKIEKTVLEVASLFPEKIVGWDIAITEEGPVVIEGNHNPHIVMAQAACGGFRGHPHYKKIFSDYI